MTGDAPVLFLHGAGRAGSLNWPQQAAAAESKFRFLDRVGEADNAASDAKRLIEAIGEGGHVVAHSYGAIAAMLAAAACPAVLSLVLFEPACFAIARGRQGAEAHIADWSPVFAVADDTSVAWREWSRRFAEATKTPVPELPDEQLERETARLRATVPPWDIEVDPLVPATVPTLVITGNWSGAYEDVGRAFAELGATHVRLPGHGHRPQDASDALLLMQRHWAGTEATRDRG